MARIHNKRYSRNIPFDAVLCDRSTIYGNPFIIGKDGNRDEVCDKYKEWVWEKEQLPLRDIIKDKLRGKDLICWCYPERCHCDTIILIANASGYK